MGATDLGRWRGLCLSLGASRQVEGVHADLVARYAAPGRVYHTLEHLSRCLEEFDGVRGLATQAGAIELALWFHDAVYESRANDNEERSAVLAEAALASMGIGGALPSRVGELVRMTRHERQPTTVDEAIILDVDLAILGQSPDVFDAYEAGVRQEYAWVDERTFWSKRGAFLRSLLARPVLFHTEACRRRYEVAARANVTRSIERTAGGPST